VLNKWAEDHREEKLTLYVCNCWPKGGAPFGIALEAVQALNPNSFNLRFIPDSAVGQHLEGGYITKVFLGAHRISLAPPGPAVFWNTQGTLSIARIATLHGIPIIVFGGSDKFRDAYEEESQSIPPEADPRRTEVERRQGKQHVSFPATGPDKITSAQIPFSIISEEGEQSFKGFALQKRNLVTLNNQTATKHTVLSIEARTEKAALIGLRGILQTPELREPEGIRPWPSVSMTAIDGVRTYDLVVALQEFDDHGDAARDLVRHFREWALDDVAKWQRHSEAAIQRADCGLDIQCYPFKKKLLEAVRAASGTLAERIDPAARFVEDSDLRTLCARLEAGSTVLFRDATLKNQLLDLSFLQPLRDRAQLSLARPADTSSCDLDLAARVVHYVDSQGGSEWLRGRVYHVDFESACTTTCIDDDVFHVLGLPLWGYDFDNLMAEMAEVGEGLGRGMTRDIIFFRSLRAWARRVAYRRHSRMVFGSRYPDDSLDHYRRLAKGALSAIQIEGGVGFLKGIDDLLDTPFPDVE
jgi:hypothetical protein